MYLKKKKKEKIHPIRLVKSSFVLYPQDKLLSETTFSLYSLEARKPVWSHRPVCCPEWMNHLPTTCVKDHTCSSQSQWQLLCCYYLGVWSEIWETGNLFPFGLKMFFFRSYCILLKVERPYILFLLRNFAFFIYQRLEQ